MSTNTVVLISPLQLAIGFIPVALVAVVMWRWSVGGATVLWASARMLLQLVLIGYALTWLFTAERTPVLVAVLVIMLSAASLIALRPLGQRARGRRRDALAAIAVGGLVTLAVTIAGVLQPEPLVHARSVIPLAGMIFASAMNAVSLAAERHLYELDQGTTPADARRDALHAAMIPMLNSFFAVGLVTLPGMMTGQILSGVEPAVATRYQVMVMCMTFSAAGLAAIVYLVLAGSRAVTMAASEASREERT